MSNKRKIYIGIAILLILLTAKKVSAAKIISQFEGIVRDKKEFSRKGGMKGRSIRGMRDEGIVVREKETNKMV